MKLNEHDGNRNMKMNVKMDVDMGIDIDTDTDLDVNMDADVDKDKDKDMDVDMDIDMEISHTKDTHFLIYRNEIDERGQNRFYCRDCTTRKCFWGFLRKTICCFSFYIVSYFLLGTD
jgi:hypothetical protein